MSELALTREEAITLCQNWARMLRREYTIDTLVNDYGDGVLMSDQLAYPLEMQPWITPEAEPLLSAIRDHAVDVDIDHTRRADWEKLLELIDQLPKNGAAK